MENNHITYKRVKINWWVFILFGGIHVKMIFSYIHQWGTTNPVDEAGFIFISITWFFIYLFIGRFKVIIDDNFAIFRSDIWVPVKIQISMIENVSVKKVPIMDLYIPGSNPVKYQFDFFASHAVKIQMKSDKTYQVAIKDAERIKEEIEKRMLIINRPQ